MAGLARPKACLREEAHRPRRELKRNPCRSSMSCSMPAQLWCECSCPVATAVSSGNPPHSPQVSRLLHLAPCCSLHMARSCTPGRRLAPPRICHHRQLHQQRLARQRHCRDARQGHACALADELEGTCSEHLPRQHSVRVRRRGALTRCAARFAPPRDVSAPIRTKATAPTRRCAR